MSIQIRKASRKNAFSTLEWKSIVGYEGLYEVCEKGYVRNVKTKHILYNQKTKYGYLCVMLSKGDKQNNRAIHRLVAQAFLPNPNNLPQVNHIDGNRRNNNLSNLEWCTASENIKHAFLIGLKKSPKYWTGKKGNEHPVSKKVEQYTMEGVLINTFPSLSSTAEYGYSMSKVFAAIKGLQKHHRKFIWKYANN